jgi:hypothetical protein
MADAIFQAKSMGRRPLRSRVLNAGAKTAGRCTENSGLLDPVVILERLIVQAFV